MVDALIDALLDSLKVLAVVVVFYILISFIEGKISRLMNRRNKFSTAIGAVSGLIPQCGISVVAADMYYKEHITMGTIIAVFIACSDEALPIMLSEPSKILMVFPLLLIKLVVGFIVGFSVDLVYKKSTEEAIEHLDHCEHEEEVHVGCCHHHIDDKEERSLHKHLLHPLLHSLKIFGYILAVNVVFALLIYYIGEDNINEFLVQNKYLTPLASSLVGVIPNCASSVVITDMYLLDNISFGACISGLIMNAGLGMIVLLRKPNMWKKTLIIFTIMFVTSLVVGYLICFIFGF